MYRGAHTRAESAPDGAAALVAPRFLDMGFDCSVIVFDRTEVPTLRPVHTVGWEAPQSGDDELRLYSKGSARCGAAVPKAGFVLLCRRRDARSCAATDP